MKSHRLATRGERLSAVLLALALLPIAVDAALAFEPLPAEQEQTLHFLQQRACALPSGPGWDYTQQPPRVCLHDEDCPGFGAGEVCRLRAWVEPDDTVLYPQVTYPPAPAQSGNGEARLRFVPLCDDGSGDHEWSMTGGAQGTPPTCAADDYIRCTSGVRPRYRADLSTNGSNDWLVHAGQGGHASSPNTSTPADVTLVTPARTAWSFAHTEDAGAYTLSQTPVNESQLTGIFDAVAANPFRKYNRVWVEKCTPDRWLGNSTHLVEDFTDDLVLEVVAGVCSDADGSGTANCADQTYCEDNWDGVGPASCAAAGYPGVPACACATRTLAAPNEGGQPGDDHSYLLYYHGRRIVRAVWADVEQGISTYGSYPLDPVDVTTTEFEAFPVPDGSSTVVFHCHSNGCNGLQGGHIDELRTLIESAYPGAVVKALFNGSLKPGVESEITVSNYDGFDVAPEDDVPDNDGVVDDTASVYDHVVDTVASTLQPMSGAVFGIDGFERQFLVDWWDPTRLGYEPPLDATCLAYHCPGTPDWTTDPSCAPCAESVHVMLNHLQTPFLYNQAQTDSVLSKRGNFCRDGGGLYEACDFKGESTEALNGGVNVVDTHWRKLVRKSIADLVRDGALHRCEGGPGSEGPYDEISVIAPDWSNHGPLSEPDVATRILDGKPLARHAIEFVDAVHPGAYGCLEDDGFENALDFTGVAACLGPRVPSSLPASSTVGLFVLAALLGGTARWRMLGRASTRAVRAR